MSIGTGQRALIAGFLALGLSLPTVSWADGPVNPTTVGWFEPTINGDGSPLEDLAGTVIRLAPAVSGPWTDVATVAAVFAAPPPNTRATFDLRTLSLAAGQYYVAVASYDTAPERNTGVQSAGFPFQMAATPPPPDTLAPVVTFGSVSSGKDPTVLVSVHDEMALQMVKVFVNGTLVTSAATNLTDWQTTVSLGRGKSTTVRVDATDAAGHVTTASREFRR